MQSAKNIKIILLVLLLINLFFCWNDTKEILQIDLGRGVNLGNALDAPQEGQWGVVIEDYFFDKIKEVGFQIVRIPIRWSAHTENIFPYRINESFFQRISHVINQALSRDLYVIINIHHFDELTESPLPVSYSLASDDSSAISSCSYKIRR